MVSGCTLCGYAYIYPNNDPNTVSYFGFINVALAIIGLLEFRKSPFLGPIWLAISYIFYSITIGRLVVPEIAEEYKQCNRHSMTTILMGQFILFSFILSLRVCSSLGPKEVRG